MKVIKESELTKLYYTIGEVADLFKVNASLIRFWEKEFSIIKPKKNKKGNRLFTPKDVVNFNMIYILVKKEGYTLEGAKKALKNKNLKKELSNKSNQNQEIISRLESVKEKLLNLMK